jgi:hypothetical protein
MVLQRNKQFMILFPKSIYHQVGLSFPNGYHQPPKGGFKTAHTLICLAKVVSKKVSSHFYREAEDLSHH